MEGISYGFTGSLPLSRWVAVPLYLVVGEGSSDTFGGYQSGLRVGRTFFVDLLVGWVRAKAKPSAGGGISAGLHVELFGKDIRWGLLPQLYVGYPFSGEAAVIQGIVGLEARIAEP